MTFEAQSKVNLTLEVLGERVDGYHALRSIVAPISLADTITLEKAQSATSDTGYDDDLCVKALEALGVGGKVSVLKRIPAGGGLGGGSADAAAVLRTANELYALGNSPEKLAEIGATFGSDIPALVLAQHYRRPVLMEGRGEVVSLMEPIAERAMVLVNPGVHSSTPEVFRAWSLTRGLVVPSPDRWLVIGNDLQAAAIKLHPEIAEALAALEAEGATECRMTGSGATSFGFASDPDEAERIAAALVKRGYQAWPATLCPK